MYKRIYDSDEIVVDLDGRKLRISVFEDGHWVDEHVVELPEPELPEVLTLEETAQYLRVSNQTVYNMLREGRIRGTKVGREWRFLRSDIVAYLCGTGMEPLGHAHWVTAYEFDFGIGEKRKTGYNCSRCGHYYIKKHDRCPNCGAHMDEIRRVGYCPICDKEVESYEEGSMTHCPICNHDIVLHEEETT